MYSVKCSRPVMLTDVKCVHSISSLSTALGRHVVAMVTLSSSSSAAAAAAPVTAGLRVELSFISSLTARVSRYFMNITAVFFLIHTGIGGLVALDLRSKGRGFDSRSGRFFFLVLCPSWQVLVVMTPFQSVLCRRFQFIVAELGVFFCHDPVKHLDPWLPSCSFSFHLRRDAIKCLLLGRVSKPSRYKSTAKVNSAFHPSRGGESSTGLSGWGKGGSRSPVSGGR